MTTEKWTPGPWRISEMWHPSITGTAHTGDRVDGNGNVFWGYSVSGSNEHGGSTGAGMTPEERAKDLAAEILRESDRHDAVPIIAAAIAAAVKDERSACLAIAEARHKGVSVRSNRARGHNDACEDISAAIRERTP